MNHLYLAAAAQHTAQWHASATEVHDLRLVGAVLLPVGVIGLIRTIVKGRRQERAVAAAAPEERAERYAA